jgi:hypothetical protein
MCGNICNRAKDAAANSSEENPREHGAWSGKGVVGPRDIHHGDGATHNHATQHTKADPASDVSPAPIGDRRRRPGMGH